jgi:adenylate cyclase
LTDKEQSPTDSETAGKKNIFIPLGFKLITITSLIVIASLAGVAAAASLFFSRDNEVRAMEDTLRFSSLISGRVKSDLLMVVEKTRTAASAVILEKDRESRNNTADRNSLTDILFRRDPDLLYAAVIKKGNDSPFREFKNRKSPVNVSVDYEAVIRSEKKNLEIAFKGEGVLMNPSAFFKSPVTGICVPFEIIDGKESVLAVFFSSEMIGEAVTALGVVKSYIVNGSGDVIIHYDSAVARSKANFASMPIVKLMMTNPNPNGQTLFADESGENYLGAFHRIGFTDGAVISTVPEKTAFAAVYKIQNIVLYITLIALGFAVIFIYLFSRTLTRPLGALVQAAGTISKGDFTVTVPATSRDEIGRLSLSFTEMARGLGEREKMKAAFGKFVNKEVAELVLRDEIKLGGERKEVAVFFSDIRSFTAISETLEPEEVVEFLNQYMTRMVRCINDTKGVVDKYIGDAIMAIWGAPLSYGNDTLNAVNAALMMRRELLEFNSDRGGPKKPIIKIGCGINSGPVLAGQIGSDDRMEYTVIGDTVNLASRVETLNKPFGTDILISSEAAARVEEIFSLHPMQKIKVKGKSEPQQIYAVLGRKDDPDAPQTIEQLRTLIGSEEPIPKKKTGKDGDSDDIEGEVKYEIIG